MKWIRAKILQITPLTNTIIQVFLQPDEYVSYRAGQYLVLKTGANQNYFSIANAPLGAKVYELHIRHEKKNVSSQDLLKHLQHFGEVEVQLPLGICHIGHLHHSRRMIFIAGGTGFAPIKSIIEQLLYSDDHRTFECYWGAKQQSDLYWQNKLVDWQKHVKTFEYLALLEGKKSYQIIESMVERNPHLAEECQFLISGPFEMVYSCRDKLLDLGVQAEYIHSDAFEFEHKDI